MYIYIYACICIHTYIYIHIKLKCSRYMPGVAQRVGRGITLLFHNRGSRRGWVVSSTPRPLFTPWKRHGTLFTGGWPDPRADLDGRKNSSPPGYDPGPSRLQSVAMPTELPGPHIYTHITISFWDHALPLKLRIHFTSTHMLHIQLNVISQN